LEPELIYRLEMLFSLAHEGGIDPRLTVPARADDFPWRLGPDDALFLWDFVTYRLLEEDAGRASAERLALYRVLRDALLSGHLPCVEREVGVLTCSDDSMHAWRAGIVTRAYAATAANADDPSAAPTGNPPGSFVARLGEVGSVAWEGCQALGQWVRAQLAPVDARRRARTAAGPLARVLAIGAYGGEHIGDAAILGGVLLRMHRRVGTRKAILVSQRPRHTEHLVPMLDTPVDVEVEEYTQAAIPSLLDRVDAVVFAGGPLMDLPKQLVKHLYAASLAHRQGKPFFIEGVGIGPFVRRPSIWTARLLARLADQIAVRTTADSKDPLLDDLVVDAGRDPAFDYLVTRPALLTRVSAVDERGIAALLRGTDGRTLVGLNIRPIRHDYTEGATTSDRAGYTRMIEDRFEQRLAEGLRRFHETAPAPVTFVFFPMNAIQFGMSDLRSAYRIHRHLPPAVDFRLWEADASLDGVVALLRKLDVAVCMRFHAAIFALTQALPVIGVDYRIGRPDKVGALLDDAGMGANCRRIDELTADWLLERLHALARKRGDS
jgi:polysaccharide pyruvyl transferase WcaK-like protein